MQANAESADLQISYRIEINFLQTAKDLMPVDQPGTPSNNSLTRHKAPTSATKHLQRSRPAPRTHDVGHADPTLRRLHNRVVIPVGTAGCHLILLPAGLMLAQTLLTSYRVSWQHWPLF